VPLEPSHPDEPALHYALRDALNGRLTNTDFFVWITVRPTGEQQEFRNLDWIVHDTETWLASLDPDAERDLASERFFHDPAAEVQIRALPKKPEARGKGTQPIVGNPEPILTGWT
jgi:hypothetical protein